MSLQVLSPGPLTTVQDVGRSGWRHVGVAHAGALDAVAAGLANRLVGNRADAAVLEITLSGPTLRLDRSARIALCGATIDASFEASGGARCPVPGGRPVTLPAGVLRLQTVRDGARTWLAFAGGIDVPQVLGSRSTDLRAGFGGFDGRVLVRGDRLRCGAVPVADIAAPTAPRWWIDPRAGESGDAPIRYCLSSHPSAPALARSRWQIGPESNRQGLRLQGPAVHAPAGDGVSAAVAPGTIQLPPDGQPIVLLADAQTVGGYPRLGHVIAADLPLLAQARAGQPLHFAPTDPTTAARLASATRARTARIELMLDSMLARQP